MYTSKSVVEGVTQSGKMKGWAQTWGPYKQDIKLL